MSEHLISPMRGTAWEPDDTGSVVARAGDGDLDAGHGIYAATYREASTYSGEMYLVAPAPGTRVVPATAGWRAEAAVVVAGPISVTDGAEAIIAAARSGYETVPLVLTEAIVASESVAAEIRDDVAGVLIALADDGDLDVRLAVVEALGVCGGDAAAAKLAAMAGDEDQDVRFAVANALGVGGGAVAVATLASMSGDAHWPVRLTVARALGACGGLAAVEALAAMSSDRDPDVRVAVAEALGACGESAVEALASMAGDAHWPVRLAVADALGVCGGEAAAKALATMASDDDLDVRAAVAATRPAE